MGMGLLERLLYAPFLAQLVVTRRCNLRCAYCTEYDAVSAPVPTEVLFERLEHLKRLGTFSVELTGGEPLLHPELEAVVRRARALGFYKVMMISNAVLLDEARIAELNAAGLQALQVSVDGVSPNDTTVKVLKVLRPKLERLARLARFEVVLSAVLGAAAGSEAVEVTRVARSLGFRPRVLVLHDEHGQAAPAPERLRELELLERSIGRRFREAGDYRRRLLEHGRAPFRCRAGSRYLYVDEHGLVHWCSQTRAAFARPLSDYDLGDLSEQFYTHKPCSERCTVGCARTQSAFDEWRAQATRRERRRLPLVNA